MKRPLFENSLAVNVKFTNEQRERLKANILKDWKARGVIRSDEEGIRMMNF